MSGYGNSTTPRGDEDGRKRATGHRVLFDKLTQVDAWWTARMFKRLTPAHARFVRLLAEALIVEQGHETAEKAGTR